MPTLGVAPNPSHIQLNFAFWAQEEDKVSLTTLEGGLMPSNADDFKHDLQSEAAMSIGLE